MNNKTIAFTDELYRYLLDHNLQETDVQRALREHTQRMAESSLQIAPEQTSLIQMLARLVGARRTLEIGVFTGYSALAVALTLPADGTLVACELNPDWIEVARRFWKEAGVDGKIDVRIGPALDSLDAMIEAGEHESFDFAFIDADKPNYVRYYERAMRLVRPGGLIAVDNTLWQGKIAVTATDAHAAAIQKLNDRVYGDERVHPALVNVGDGMTLALKKQKDRA
ncbi:MAG: class I SAM-dependent methyltransferase [Spirochaetota bacterium]